MACGTSTECFWDMRSCNPAYECTQILHLHAHTKIFSGMHAQGGRQGITIKSMCSRQRNKEFSGHRLRKVKTIRHKLGALSWSDMLCMYVFVNMGMDTSQTKCKFQPSGISVYHCLCNRPEHLWPNKTMSLSLHKHRFKGEFRAGLYLYT